MKVGKKISQLRESRTMTQKELAERLDIGVTYLSKIENDRLTYSLSEEKLKKIVDVLNLNNEEERELFNLAKKISPTIKEILIQKPAVYRFLRTIPPDWDNKRIEKFIKGRNKKPEK